VNACRIRVSGVVQGVGFRPHVCTLARTMQLGGWVRNDAAGVEIHVEGGEDLLAYFVRRLEDEAPRLAHIERVTVEALAPEGLVRFAIEPSEKGGEGILPVSPDVAVCDACLREMGDPDDRRYRYPFVNCTDCGPRYTIVRDVPYDRAQTTMAGFPLCSACAREYADPRDRRFHAQPVACPECGPHVRLERAGRVTARREAALGAARRILREGGILALKGLGGFHLACDAGREEAVLRLRARKVRDEKPFALMAVDIAAAERCVELSASARRMLRGQERPVVLLPRRPSAPVAASVAPGRDRLGVMLPYTPLHHLLLERTGDFPEVLVMTSGNRSDEPIAYEDDDARQRLAELADALLLHDRPIQVRTDDSVVGEFRERLYPLRRARGYAPLPVTLPFPVPPLLAVGGDLKNTYCVAQAHSAFLGPHVGDLSYVANLEAFEQGVRHVERLFRIRPRLVAHDLHPDYRSTRYALARARADGLPSVAVQHHHAHVAAAMAEQGLPRDARVIGVAFDGTGYGTDGTIWGGEFLLARYDDFERAAYLAPVALPGGDGAIRAPWRSALAWLTAAGEPWARDLPPIDAASATERGIVARQLSASINAPRTSSVGRLFDAVASLIGLRHESRYEGQAACELEAIAGAAVADAYAFDVRLPVVDPAPVIRRIVADVRAGVPPATVAARFHRGLADAVVATCRRLGDKHELETVILSGGVWQNLRLLDLAVAGLEAAGLDVRIHRTVPPNDGGLALGQAVVAAARSHEQGEASRSRSARRRAVD